jgi:hypothetical protein
MKNSKVYAATVLGTTTLVKAHYKVNAIARFQQQDNTVRAKDVRVFNVINSQQACVEESHPEVCVK